MENDISQSLNVQEKVVKPVYSESTIKQQFQPKLELEKTSHLDKKSLPEEKADNLKEFCDAVKNIDKIKPSNCQKWGMKYTLDKIAPMYKRYFTQILNLATPKGWYAE